MMLFKSYAGKTELEAVEKVLKRGTFWLNGPEVSKFEDKVADISKREHAVAFNSGTTALYTLLIKSGVTGEVILPSLTYPATANAVHATGAQPVFADIEEESLGLSFESVKEKITPRTRAIIPVHFGGTVCKEIDSIKGLADEHDIWVIEDAAQSFGAMRDGEMVGNFGDSAMFSFSYNKIISTGAGGMIVTDSEDISDRCRQFGRQGKDSVGSFSNYGLNFSMPSINAALGLAQLDKLSFMIEKRRSMAEYLDSELRKVDILEPAHQPLDNRNRPVFQMYNVLCSDRETRDNLRDHLSNEGIMTRISYKPVHWTPFYRDMNIDLQLPVTREIASRILTLPFHLYLEEEDLDEIVDSIRRFERG